MVFLLWQPEQERHGQRQKVRPKQNRNQLNNPPPKKNISNLDRVFFFFLAFCITFSRLNVFSDIKHEPFFSIAYVGMGTTENIPSVILLHRQLKMHFDSLFLDIFFQDIRICIYKSVLLKVSSLGTS